MENILFKTASVLYFTSILFYLLYAFTRRERWSSIGMGLVSTAVSVHLVSLIMRMFIGRMMPNHEWYVPWSNWYESFSLFALVVAAEFLIIQRVNQMPIIGAFVTPLIGIILAVGLSSPYGHEIPQLPPALQSGWMAIHVPVMFISYSAFANAFALGIAYLIQERQLKSKRPSHLVFRLPSLEDLDNLIYRVITFTLPVLTLGIFLGALWANDAWGRYWAWDPKETWSFVTWMVYIIYVHVRLLLGWRGKRTVYFSLIGFIVVLVTYLGVNYLSELHGFLSGGGR